MILDERIQLPLTHDERQYLRAARSDVLGPRADARKEIDWDEEVRLAREAYEKALRGIEKYPNVNGALFERV